MDSILWWTGAVTWAAFALVGVFALFDVAVDWVFTTLMVKREFFAFVADRFRKKYHRDPV